MIEVTNKGRSPVQLVVRSRLSPNQFTTLNVPGIGAGKNVILLQDEVVTDVIERVEKMGMNSTRYVK